LILVVEANHLMHITSTSTSTSTSTWMLLLCLLAPGGQVRHSGHHDGQDLGLSLSGSGLLLVWRYTFLARALQRPFSDIFKQSAKRPLLIMSIKGCKEDHRRLKK
jgi:hypothetical protein